MKKRREKTFQNQFNAARVDGVQALGLCVVCDLYGVREAREQVQRKFEAAGLSTEYLTEKRDKTAFLDALKSLEESEILVKVEDTYEYVTYQCDAAGADFHRAANVQKTALVRLYKNGPKAGSVESDTPGVADNVTVLIEAERVIVRTQDVSKALRRLIEREADTVNLTVGGGVWFVPTNFLELLRRVEEFIGSLNGRNMFSVLPVADKPENRRSYWASIEGEIRRQIADIEAGIDDLRQLPGEDEAHPKHRIQNLFSLIREKRQRLEAYAGLFEMQAHEITEKLDTLHADLMNAAAIP